MYCNTTCDDTISILLPDQSFNIINSSKLYIPLTHPQQRLCKWAILASVILNTEAIFNPSLKLDQEVLSLCVTVPVRNIYTSLRLTLVISDIFFSLSEVRAHPPLAPAKVFSRKKQYIKTTGEKTPAPCTLFLVY